MFVALLGARPAGHRAGLGLRTEHAAIRLRLSDKNAAGGVAGVERYGGEPLSIQVRKRSTFSAGQRPSQGMLPAESLP